MADILKPERKEIDGETFEFYFLPIEKSMKTLVKLFKIVGPAMGELAEAVPEGGNVDAMLDEEVAASAFIRGLAIVADRVSDEEIWEICRTMIDRTKDSKGMDIQTASYFEGRPMHLLKVAGTSIWFNYKDFLKGFVGTAQKRNSKVKARRPTSPKTSE